MVDANVVLAQQTAKSRKVVVDEETSTGRYNYILHELLADGTDLLGQRG